jgi:PAS domain S-box-containing protein
MRSDEQHGGNDAPGTAPGLPLVLFVDDDPAIGDLAGQYFRTLPGIQVRVMQSADDALAYHARARADAIISDYEMPGMDGIAFLKLLRKKGDETPFIIFTGRGREEVAMEALNFGADFYLQKRGDPDTEFFELRSMVLQSIQRRRSQNEARELAERVEQQAQILDEILSSIADPVLIIDSGGYLTYANLAGAKIFGFSRMAILEKRLNALAMPAEAARTLEGAAEHVFSTGLRDIADIVLKDGEGPRYYQCSLAPLHTSKGRINAVDIIFRNTTSENRISQELRDCRSQADALLRSGRRP